MVNLVRLWEQLNCWCIYLVHINTGLLSLYTCIVSCESLIVCFQGTRCWWPLRDRRNKPSLPGVIRTRSRWCPSLIATTLSWSTRMVHLLALGYMFPFPQCYVKNLQICHGPKVQTIQKYYQLQHVLYKTKLALYTLLFKLNISYMIYIYCTEFSLNV